MISPGFISRRSIGMVCRAIIRCSRVWAGEMLMVVFGSLPCCADKNMYREYVAVRRVPTPVIKIVMLDQLNKEDRIRSSPVRLIVGGRAMFIRLATNHHAVISGRTSCKPRANSMVRLCVRS